jgi:hypothetical protein
MKYFSTLRPEYLPSLEYFWKIVQCDFVVITEHIQYTKRSPISVSSPFDNEDSLLRIPVLHKPPFESIFNKRVDDHNNWRKSHFKTLQHKFHQYPYGYYYLPFLEEFYQSASSNLSGFLIKLIQNLVIWLNLELKIYPSGELDYNLEPHLFIKSCQNKFNGAEYLITREALEKKWLDKDILYKKKVHYAYFAQYPNYHILIAHKDKSVLTFLMQFGPEAGYILKQYL